MKGLKNVRPLLPAAAMLLTLVLGIIPSNAVAANAVTPGVAGAAAVGATWISIWSPFTGDSNNNSYTSYALGTSVDGPWTPVSSCGNGVPGPSAWRRCAIESLTPGAIYFVQVTFTDPDGVIGANPQVVGPIQTNPNSVAAASVGKATATVGPTTILVSVPIGNDSDANSSLSNVSIATSSGGPWTQVCYNGALISPALCSIHGLTRHTSYYIQVTVSDPDGVVGTNPQVIGPIHYTGLTDLALNKNITADPGWGCCSNPSQLVDGVVQYADWVNGFAWTGGTGDWGGGTPGFKQAVIDLGEAMTVNRMDVWPHDPSAVPTTWLVSTSTDGFNFTDAAATMSGNCRTPTLELLTAWYYPSCAQSATFPAVSARYVRFWSNDYSLFTVTGGCPTYIEVNGQEVCGIHEWISEIEVFGPNQ
jgi:hypothetical protein